MSALKWLERHFEELICCGCLIIISSCVFGQVVSRYVFSSALQWTEEVAAMAMVWAVYSGAALCVRERFHIRIIVGVRALPQKFGRIVIFVADICWAFFCIFMVKVGWDYLLVAWKFPTISPSLGVNQFYPQTILVIGYALMLLRLIQQYIHWLRDGGHGLPGMLDEEWDETIDQKEHQI